MTNSQRLAAVRRCLDRWLEAQHHDEDIDIRDAVLICGGFYVGRKFELGPYRATWFMEEDEIKVHDASGKLVVKFSAVDIDQASTPILVSRVALPMAAREAVAASQTAAAMKDVDAIVAVATESVATESVAAADAAIATVDAAETTNPARHDEFVATIRMQRPSTAAISESSHTESADSTASSVAAQEQPIRRAA